MKRLALLAFIAWLQAALVLPASARQVEYQVGSPDVLSITVFGEAA